MLPLTLVGFIGSSAVAAKSYFPRRVCCLCSRWVSSGPRRWQQNPTSRGAFAAFDLGGFHRVQGGGSKNLLPEALLLPLTLVCFFGSKVVAAKSCSLGAVAAFDLGGFHRVQDGGSKNLLPEALLLPLTLVGFIGSSAVAAKYLLL